MSTIICRICEHEVPIKVLKDHSYKCKAYHDKRDKLINLNNRILRKIENASKHKNELTKDIRLLIKLHNTQEKFNKIDDMLRKVRLLKKIIQYGERVTRISSSDYDNRLERGLLAELERKFKDLEGGGTVRLISRFQELISKKITLSLELSKLERELALVEKEEEITNESQSMNLASPKVKNLIAKRKPLKLQTYSPQRAVGNDDVERRVRIYSESIFSGASKPVELPQINKCRRLLQVETAELRSGNSLHSPRLKSFFSNSPHLKKSCESGTLMSPLGNSPNEQNSPSLPRLNSQKTSPFTNSYSQSTVNPETKRNKLSSFSREQSSPSEVMDHYTDTIQEEKIKELIKKDKSKSSRQNNLYKDILKKGVSTLEFIDCFQESSESYNSPFQFDKQTASEGRPSEELPRSKSPEKDDEYTPLTIQKICSEEHIALPDEDEGRPRVLTAPKDLRRPSNLHNGLHVIVPKSRFSAAAKQKIFAEDETEERKGREESIENDDSSISKDNSARRDWSTSPLKMEKVASKENATKNDLELQCLVSPTLKGYFSDTAYHSFNWRPEKQHKTSIEDFQFIKMISKGAYGKVWLVKHKLTGDLYAMKLINSSEKMNENRIASLKAEKNVFERLEGDSVVKAVYTFTHGNYICFVMEYMVGGDFGSILERYGFLEEKCARFYIGELILAIESLHKIGIVHRDLKPDNILLDAKGHVKLADFGLSEVGLDQKRHLSTKTPPTLKVGQPKTPELIPRSPNTNMTSNKANGASINNENLNQFTKKTSMVSSPARLKDSQEMNSVKLITPDRIKISRTSNNENLSPFVKKTSTILSPVQMRSSQENNRSSFSSEHSQARIMIKPPAKGETTPHKSIRIIGTPDYMAPEIIQGLTNTDKSIDWWAVGVILYEFLVGIPPFNDETVNGVFDNIVNLRIEWPHTEDGSEYLTPEAKSLIAELLTKDPAKRLGSQGVEEIKKHPFFKGFNWENLREKEGPLKSIVKNETDTSNFHKESQIITEEEKQVPFSTPKNTNSSTLRKQLDLKKFQMKRRDLLLQLNLQDYERYTAQQSK